MSSNAMWALCAALCLSTIGGAYGVGQTMMACQSGLGLNGNACPAGTNQTSPANTCYNLTATTTFAADDNATAAIRCYSPTTMNGTSAEGSCTGTIAEAVAFCDALVRHGAEDWHLATTIDEVGAGCGTGCGADAAEVWVMFSTTSPTTATPTMNPTMSPTTESPTMSPTTKSPTASPTASPTMGPTAAPTMSPTAAPLLTPSGHDILVGLSLADKNVSDLGEDFDMTYAASIAASMADLGSPIDASQVTVLEKTNRVVEEPATRKLLQAEMMMSKYFVDIKSAVLGVGETQDASYFDSFIGLIGNTSAIGGLLGDGFTVASATAEKAVGDHLVTTITFLDHPLSTFTSDETFKMMFETDLKSEVANVTRKMPSDVTVLKYAMASNVSTDVTLYVPWLESKELATTVKNAMIDDAMAALPLTVAKYGNITASAEVPGEINQSPPSPTAAATKETGFTSVLFSLLAAGVLAQMNRN